MPGRGRDHQAAKQILSTEAESSAAGRTSLGSVTVAISQRRRAIPGQATITSDAISRAKYTGAFGAWTPIALDNQGRILDGRNRHAARKLAGVEPVFATYDGGDPDGYALASGTLRRNLTQGQLAIVIAKSHNLCKFGEQTEKGRAFGVPQQRLSEALLIVEQARPGPALESAPPAEAGGALSCSLAGRSGIPCQ